MPSAGDDSTWRGSITRFWQRSYAADYLGLLLLVCTLVFIQEYVEPFHRMFSLDDRSLSYPHAAIERVSSIANSFYCGGLPLVAFILWFSIRQPGAHQAHVTILGLAISLITTELLTDVIKNTVGRPRPDLLARCKPATGTPSQELVTVVVCTESDHHTLHDGFRSFPSGHSSFAFAGLGYFALYMAGQLMILRRRANLVSCLLPVVPLIGAALVAISRLEDYRHDVYDVTAGSIIGMSLAYLSYRRYYRSLRHRNCHIPYPSQTNNLSMNGKFRRIDEERSVTGAAEFELEDTDDDRSEELEHEQGEIGRS